MWPPLLLVSGLVTLKEGVSRVHRHHSSNFHTSSLSEQNRTKENTKQHNTFYTSFLTTMTLPTLHKAHFSSFPLSVQYARQVFLFLAFWPHNKNSNNSTFVFITILHTIFSGNQKYHRRATWVCEKAFVWHFSNFCIIPTGVRDERQYLVNFTPKVNTQEGKLSPTFSMPGLLLNLLLNLSIFLHLFGLYLNL